MSEFIKIQQEARKSAYEQAKALLDNAASEKRDLSGEETQTYERIMADIDERAKLIDSIKATAEREERAAEAAASFKPTEDVRSNDNDILRAIATGERRGFEFVPSSEQRTLVGSSNTVPASFYNQVFQVARLVGPMLQTSQIFNTTSGENLTIPTLTARSTAAVSTATQAISASDPTFSSITLGAYKYSFLVGVANELIADAGFDLTSLIAEQAGNEIGYRVNNDLTLGTGTVQPNGLSTVAGSAVLGGTGVSGAFTYDNLIDLIYKVDGAARQLPGVGFQMSSTGLGTLRKLKDGAGNYIFVPGTAGQPDQVLGYNLYENPAVAAVGTGNKSVLFGHLPSYKVRIAGGIDVAQSPDYAFNQDVTTFRVKMRVDGNLTHATHVQYFKGAAS
jgi:HK97 family phage major capsid protein